MLGSGCNEWVLLSQDGREAALSFWRQTLIRRSLKCSFPLKPTPIKGNLNQRPLFGVPFPPVRRTRALPSSPVRATQSVRRSGPWGPSRSSVPAKRASARTSSAPTRRAAVFLVEDLRCNRPNRTEARCLPLSGSLPANHGETLSLPPHAPNSAELSPTLFESLLLCIPEMFGSTGKPCNAGYSASFRGRSQEVNFLIDSEMGPDGA